MSGGLRIAAEEADALRAAVIAFCTRNGNAVRLTREIGVDAADVSKFRRGSARGISYDLATALVAALSRLPFVPTDGEPSARRSLSPQERAAISARVAEARRTHSASWIAKRAGVQKHIVYNASTRPEVVGRASYDALNRALDSLGVPRVEVASPPAIALPDLSKYAAVSADEAAEIRAQLAARCEHRGLPKRIAARSGVSYARICTILDGAAVYAREAASLHEVLGVIPPRALDEDTLALRVATIRRIEAFRTRRGRGSSAELARVSGISQQRISAGITGRLSFGRGSIDILNRALDALESQTTSTTGAAR